MKDLILIINPGSTSTKVAIYSMKEEKCMVENEINHGKKELSQFPKLMDQRSFRKKHILNFVKNNNIELNDFSCVIGRGGLLHPIEGGIYEVNDKLLEDLTEEKYGSHASNLGAILAYEIASPLGKRSFIAEPVTVDEFEPLAYVTGFKGLVRKCRAHVLNMRQVARRLSDKLGLDLSKSRFIGVHLGGGITIAAMKDGKFIDVNNALLGEGPFSPERTGTLPVEDVINMSYSGKYTKNELKKLLTKKGGLYSYLGTTNFLEILKRIEDGDEEAKFYVEAFAYRIAKTIGEMATVLYGKIDGIFVTGGIARSAYLMDLIKERVNFIGKIFIFPGQFEMFALGRNAHFAMAGKKKVKYYE
ncbi:butyrate kinase [bacterium]|nr:butyrate kinase [bacterium]